jgi:pimeloyl-ACP methyl ester carboxylesterase
MHLNNPDIDLQTHINGVVNLVLFEDLHDVVLTGHSYGGMVITGVIDRIPERIRHVVFLDAAVPDDGMSLWDHFGGSGPPDPSRFADGFMQVPWVKPGTTPPHSVKHSTYLHIYMRAPAAPSRNHLAIQAEIGACPRADGCIHRSAYDPRPGVTTDIRDTSNACAVSE